MKTKSLMVLFALFLTLSLAGCQSVTANTDSEDSIIGTWQDSFGLTEYKFEQGGKMKLEALNLGSFKGTYLIDGDQITIEYRIVVKDVKDTYQLKLDGSTMYLNGNQFTRKK